MKTRVLLVDDHAILREALRLMLEQAGDIEVVAEAGDGQAALDLAARIDPDVIVMDAAMPVLSGAEATRRILRKNPKAKVLALTAYTDKRFVTEMMNAGALGYVTKTAAGDKLLEAIRTTAQGQPYLCPEVSAVLLDSMRSAGSVKAQSKTLLGRREREVLGLLAEGKSSPEIGKQLHIAPSTVDVHRRNIMRKLDLHSVAELTKYAIREGLTSS
jgi:two-component system NarL family response regulator